MVDIFEIQCSINRAVSSVLGFKGAENEVDSLKSLCSALESLKLNKNTLNKAKTDHVGLEYETEEDLYQFLDNLRRVMDLFCSRLQHSKSLDSQVSHLYIKLFLNITKTLKNNNYQFQYDILSVSLLKIWCEVLCLPGSNRIDLDCLKRNHSIFIDYIPLVLSTYRGVKNTEDLNRLLYVILEVLRVADDQGFLSQILESLELVPESFGFSEFISVYPGVISKVFNKLQDLNLVLFSKAIDSMVVWFRYFLDSRKEVYSSKLKQFNPVLKYVDNKEEILEKTEESIKMIIKRFKNTRQQSVAFLCIRCMDYEFLDVDLRYMMGRCILESVSKKDVLSILKESIKGAPISFNLILRDMVTRSINESDGIMMMVDRGNEEKRENEKRGEVDDEKDKDNEEKLDRDKGNNSSSNDNNDKGLEVFNSYLMLREYLTWEIDHYLVLKFLINNFQVDFTGVNEKILLNRKYLVDRTSIDTERYLEKPKEVVKTFSSKYFDSLSNELKLETLSNLLSVYNNSSNVSVSLRILHLMNEVISSFYRDYNDNNNTTNTNAFSNNSDRNSSSTDKTSTTTSNIDRGDMDCSSRNNSNVDERSYTRSLVDYEGFWELKSILVSERMFEQVKNVGKDVQNVYLINLTKIKIMDLLSLLVRNSKRGDLSHRDIECILFNVVPEYNSDYVKVHQSSFILLRELSNYFSRFIKDSSSKSILEDFKKIIIVDKEESLERGKENYDKEESEDEKNEQKCEEIEEVGKGNEENDDEYKEKKEDSDEIEDMLEYYTNSLSKRIIYSIGDEGVSDLMYSLTKFSNESMEMKVIFDLTVQFCKYFDSLCQELPEYNLEVDKNNTNGSNVNKDMNMNVDLGRVKEIESNYNKLIKVFYSFDYILMFVNKNFNEQMDLEYNKDKGNNSSSNDNNDKGLEVDEVVEQNEDDDGKGDYILSTSTLMITRARYYVFSKNTTVKYLALMVLYRGLITVSSNEYIFRIRVHEVWDCISHALEMNLNQFRVVAVLLEIFQLISLKIFYFIEKRLMSIFEILEQIVLNEEQVVGVADERNSTVRYKCYLAIVKFTEEISKRVNNRSLFSKIMLISIKIHTPKTCGTIKEKLDQIFLNLSKKDPTLVRNVLLEINKGESMNTSFIKYAFKKDLKTLFSKIPPQRILLDLPIIN